MCPWVKTCVSRKQDRISERPRLRPRAAFEIWQWDFQVATRNIKVKKKIITEIFLVENEMTPFLKKNWLPYSTAKKLSKKPKKYDLKHGVTKFDIFCGISVLKKIPGPKSELAAGRWVDVTDIQKINPTSLMKKIIGFISEK